MTSPMADMAVTEAVCCQYRQIPCRWCSKFSTPPSCISTAERKPAIDIAAEVNATDEPIQFFMRDNEESWNCSSRVVYVQEFCDDGSLDAFEETSELPLVALVEEVILENRATKHQPDPRALNARQLLRYLSETEYQENKSVLRKEVDPRVNSEPSENTTAYRRRIFVANLDYLTVLTFVRTASESQAWALRDSIYNHLARKPSMKATVSQVNLLTFRLAIDLPYYALRESESPIQDISRKGNGGALRNCEDLSFLIAHPHKPEEVSYLCEAHFSCVVSGTNDARCEIHAFNDTYFDHEECIEEFVFDRNSAEQIQEDPLRPGKPAYELITDPRHYFLDVFAVRIKRIRGDWRKVLYFVDKHIKQSIQFFKFGLQWPTYPGSLPNEVYNVSVEDVHSWTSRTIDLVARLTQDISSLNNHWGVFNSQREDYFGNMFGPAQQKLQVIQDTFLELAAYTKDFNDLKERCMMFSQERESHLSFMRYEITRKSMETAEETKKLVQMQHQTAKHTDDLAQVQCNTAERTNLITEMQYQTAEQEKLMTRVLMALTVLSLTSQTLAIPKDKNLVPADVRYIALMLGLFGAIAVAVYMFLAHKCWKLLQSIAIKVMGFLVGLFYGVLHPLRDTHLGNDAADLEMTP